ncbi:MAG: cobyric acid synthase, partial [Candidatus Binatia bacterium]
PRPVTAGLSLLPVTTRFSPQKSTHQVNARVLLGHGILAQAKDCQVTGYEIHMGETTSAQIARPFQIEQRSQQVSSDFDGALSADGNVLGTYIHGLFHNNDFRRGILRELADRKGKVLPPAHSRFSVDEQYDRLAALVRDNLNMELILSLLDRS